MSHSPSPENTEEEGGGKIVKQENWKECCGRLISGYAVSAMTMNRWQLCLPVQGHQTHTHTCTHKHMYTHTHPTGTLINTHTQTYTHAYAFISYVPKHTQAKYTDVLTDTHTHMHSHRETYTETLIGRKVEGGLIGKRRDQQELGDR